MRPTFNADNVKDIIIDWFNDGKTHSTISEQLKAEYDVKVSERTIYTLLKRWGLTRRMRVVETGELKARIAYLFFLGFNDIEILHVLKLEEFKVEKWSLARMRRNMGLWRRLSVFDRAQQEDQLREAIKEELDKGTIEGYGKGLLYTHFRAAGYIATRFTRLHITFVLDSVTNAFQQKIHLQHSERARSCWSSTSYSRYAAYQKHLHCSRT
jgi:hypothetical protein